MEQEEDVCSTDECEFTIGGVMEQEENVCNKDK